MEVDKRTVLVVGFVVEALLAGIFFVWAAASGFTMPVMPSSSDLVLGCGFAILLCAFNYLTFGLLGVHFQVLRRCIKFIDEIIKPLADSLGPISALFISVCAGVGEELFFRGMLQNIFGIVIASVLFAVLHFGPAVREHLFLTAVYAVIGLYFGLLYSWSGSLWLPIVVHTVYDYIALMYLRYRYKSPLAEQG